MKNIRSFLLAVFGLIRSFGGHLLHYGETYIVIPLTLLLALGSIGIYHWQNGRDNVDDGAGALVAAMLAMVPLVLLVSFVGFIQTRYLGFRAHLKDRAGVTIWDDLYDVGVFIALFWSFAHFAHL